MTSPAFVRPVRHRWVGGVCSAIANRYRWDVGRVRVGMLLLVAFTGVGAVLYVALWIAIPSEF